MTHWISILVALIPAFGGVWWLRRQTRFAPPATEADERERHQW